MGRVFLAEHRRLGRKVAIKLLDAEHASKPEPVKRFFGEARAVNQLSDEHLVEITDFVEEGEHTYYVMEYLEGQDLSEMLEEGGPLATDRAVELGIQMAGVLAKVHDAGIIHRDLKPANVFVTRRHGKDLVKLLDFGIAKMRGAEDGSRLDLTAEGTVLGTPEYMSPEQAGGETVDHRTDIYALGLVLYAATTGRPPFSASSYGEMIVKHLTVRPPSPNEVMKATRGRIPASLESLILNCLEKSRDERPENMTAIRERLEMIRDEMSGAGEAFSSTSRPSRSSRPAGSSSRKPSGPMLALVGGLVGIAGIVAALALTWPLSDGAPAPPDPSQLDSSTTKIESQHAGHEDVMAATSHETESFDPDDQFKSPVDPTSESKTAKPKTVKLFLRSRPQGATVYRGAASERVGKTPLTLEVEPRDAEELFRFELDGHEVVTEEVSLNATMRLSVTLPERRVVRRPPPSPPVRKERDLPQKTRPAKTKTEPKKPSKQDTQELLDPFSQ